MRKTRYRAYTQSKIRPPNSAHGSPRKPELIDSLDPFSNFNFLSQAFKSKSVSYSNLKHITSSSSSCRVRSEHSPHKIPLETNVKPRRNSIISHASNPPVYLKPQSKTLKIPLNPFSSGSPIPVPDYPQITDWKLCCYYSLLGLNVSNPESFLTFDTSPKSSFNRHKILDIQLPNFTDTQEPTQEVFQIRGKQSSKELYRSSAAVPIPEFTNEQTASQISSSQPPTITATLQHYTYNNGLLINYSYEPVDFTLKDDYSGFSIQPQTLYNEMIQSVNLHQNDDYLIIVHLNQLVFTIEGNYTFERERHTLILSPDIPKDFSRISLTIPSEFQLFSQSSSFQ